MQFQLLHLITSFETELIMHSRGRITTPRSFCLLVSHILNLFRIDLSIMLVLEEGLDEKRMAMADSIVSLYCLDNSVERLALAKRERNEG